MKMRQKIEPRRPVVKQGGERADRLRLFGMPQSFVKLIRFLAIHPAESWRFRELQTRVRTGSASLQRDLARLVELGVLVRHEKSSSVSFSLNHGSRVWWSLLQLIRELSDPALVLREAIRNVAGVDAAFIFGSTAKGTSVKDSDIDLFVVADNLNRSAFYRNIAEAGQVMGKAINTIEYSKVQLAHRLAAKTRFVREVLQGQKLWVGGDPDQIAPFSIAAGIAEPVDKIPQSVGR